MRPTRKKSAGLPVSVFGGSSVADDARSDGNAIKATISGSTMRIFSSAE